MVFQRRQFVLVLLGGLLTVNAMAKPPERSLVFGHSVQGRPLQAFVLGTGLNVTMILGGFHGNERSGPGVVRQMRLYLQQNPAQWQGCTVVLVPSANPDGWAANTRVNARRVDLNRNFPGSWQPATLASRLDTSAEARHNPGPAAASEPETQAIIALVGRYAPAKIVSLHQPLHLLNWTGRKGRALAAAMGRENHYPQSSSVGYVTPGALGDYCGRQGIGVVTLELPRGTVARGWEQNRTALLAAIRWKE